MNFSYNSYNSNANGNNSKYSSNSNMGYGVASKPKSYNNSLTPLTVLMLRQVQADPLQIIDNIEVAKALIVARIISIKSMNGRLLLKVTDGTEVVQIIQGSLNYYHPELYEECYYRFTVAIKADKNEQVIYCYHYERITDYNLLAYHFNLTMFTSVKRQSNEQ